MMFADSSPLQKSVVQSDFEMALDVTRLVGLRWSGNLATGIDRVCLAYLERYRRSARAVVQHRGIRRIFTKPHSEALFDLLVEPQVRFRRRLARLSPSALMASREKPACGGAFYVNVGHTDLDRPDLAAWLRACDLRPIYMIHDLIPLTHAEFCTQRATSRHRARVDNALMHACGIITNSESTAQDIRQYARCSRRRMPPHAANWLAGADFQAGDRHAPLRGRYFVVVSTIEGRKNHFMLLQIWRRLVETMGHTAPHLVIIGQKGAQASHVQDMLDQCEIIRHHVSVLSHCTDAELGNWISYARALLFPSFAEGFGLPLVEALQLGTPVIASDIPTFREIGMNIPTLIDPLDAPGWEAAIIGFTGDCAERERQMLGLARYRAWTWGAHFDKFDAWLASLRPDRQPAAQSDVADVSVGAAVSAGVSFARVRENPASRPRMEGQKG